MKKNSERFLIIFFILILFAVPAFTIKAPKQNYSAYENRNLAEWPAFSWKSFLNGSYTDKLEKYYEDHFVARDQLLESFVSWEMHVLKKPVINDVTIQGDTLLPFLGFEDNDYHKYNKSVNKMADSLADLNETVTKNGGKFYYIGVPIQQSVMRNLYPSYLDNSSKLRNYLENNFFDALSKRGIQYLDLYPFFSEQKDCTKYYSKVDHHYNYLGALEAYQQIMGKINTERKEKLTVLTKEDLNFKTIDLPFYGSRSRKLYNQFLSSEHLLIATPKDPISFERVDHGADVENTVFTMPEKGDTYVTYDVYMGGDKGETVIQTNRPELPNVLIFGDSFTNPIETLLYYSFNEMHSLDLRIYKERTLTQYIESYKPDIVICVRDDTMYVSAKDNGKFR